MIIKCDDCGRVLKLDLKQKMISEDCEAKIHFSIVELICQECGSTKLVSLGPKSVHVFNEKLKLVNF